MRAFHSERSPRAGCDVHTSTPNLASTKKVCAQEALEPEFSLRLTGIGPLSPCPSLHCQRKPSGWCGDVSNWLFRSRSPHFRLRRGSPSTCNNPQGILECAVPALLRLVGHWKLAFPQVERVFGWYMVSTSLSAVKHLPFPSGFLELVGGLHCSLLYQQNPNAPKNGTRNTNANAGGSLPNGC